MDILEKQLLKTLREAAEKAPQGVDSIDLNELIEEVTPDAIEIVKSSLANSTQQMLKERRKQTYEFEQRNIKRWSEAFDLLEAHIVICTEAGENFNKSYRPAASDNCDIVFDITVRLHARACQISQEILCLLKSGFADAAHARWRALHEVAATALFITKHGQECAERFYYHDVVDSYDGMLEHRKYEHRLQEKGPSQEEIETCKALYDSLIEKYGKQFSEHYGWASYLFPSNRRVGFAAIEKDVELDHMRPYYKWASQNIHSGSKGMRNRLGLSEAIDDVLLVGQSNSGMTDPAHAAALSLSQITVALLVLKPTLDHIVLMNIICDYEKEVGQAFLAVEIRGDVDQNNPHRPIARANRALRRLMGYLATAFKFGSRGN